MVDVMQAPLEEAAHKDDDQDGEVPGQLVEEAAWIRRDSFASVRPLEVGVIEIVRWVALVRVDLLDVVCRLSEDEYNGPVDEDRGREEAEVGVGADASDEASHSCVAPVRLVARASSGYSNERGKQANGSLSRGEVSEPPSLGD